MATKQLKSNLVFSTRLAGHDFTFHTSWGLFSPKAIDEGTGLLAKYLELPPTATVLDLGCGYGPLGLLAAKLAPQGRVHLVDKDFVAVDFARRNAELNQAGNTQIYLSNGFSHVPPGLKFDAVISNLPAKIGGELTGIFLNDAYARLNPGGRLYIVTISGLKDYMKRQLTEVFGNYKKLGQAKTYTAALAVKSDPR
jgi:16S rRNA (guanine1207-N2)-methyltransferase